MSLENLLKIGQLKSHPADVREIEQLLAAARRNVRDARVTSGTWLITPEMTSTNRPRITASLKLSN